MFRQELHDLVLKLGEQLRKRQFTFATAESCTGGLVAATITDIAGVSAWYEGSVVSYSNRVKTIALGVPEEMLEKHGAVSEEVANAMCEGLLENLQVDLGCSITGIAGPEGGTEAKPVGTCWIGWKLKAAKPHARHFIFEGDRESVRTAAVHQALQGALELL